VLVPGTNHLDVSVPDIESAGTSFMRFRFSTQANLSWFGLATDGEAEDYEVGLKPALRITKLFIETNGYLHVEWNDVALEYTLLKCTNLATGVWSPPGGTSWPISENYWGVFMSSNAAGFFRVRAHR